MSKFRFSTRLEGMPNLGQAMAAMANYRLSKDYTSNLGSVNLLVNDQTSGDFAITDTAIDPLTSEFVKQLRTVGIRFDSVTKVSDRVIQLGKVIQNLIKSGDAYFDHLPSTGDAEGAEKTLAVWDKEMYGSWYPSIMISKSTDPSQASMADDTVEETAESKAEMVIYKPKVLRARLNPVAVSTETKGGESKSDVSIKGTTDPILAVIDKHHKLIYEPDFFNPTLDFLDRIIQVAVPNDYLKREPLYRWTQSKLAGMESCPSSHVPSRKMGGIVLPTAMKPTAVSYFPRLSMQGMPLSNKSQKWVIDQMTIDVDWSSPMLATIGSLLRRGVVPETIRKLLIHYSRSKSEKMISWSTFWSSNISFIDQRFTHGLSKASTDEKGSLVVREAKANLAELFSIIPLPPTGQHILLEEGKLAIRTYSAVIGSNSTRGTFGVPLLPTLGIEGSSDKFYLEMRDDLTKLFDRPDSPREADSKDVAIPASATADRLIKLQSGTHKLESMTRASGIDHFVCSPSIEAKGAKGAKAPKATEAEAAAGITNIDIRRADKRSRKPLITVRVDKAIPLKLSNYLPTFKVDRVNGKISFSKALNPDRCIEADGMGDSSMAEIKVGDIFKIEGHGYFTRAATTGSGSAVMHLIYIPFRMGVSKAALSAGLEYQWPGTIGAKLISNS
jgi:glutamyl/glutaminyl-tRNA synthetase